jgi:hypothetical protein
MEDSSPYGGKSQNVGTNYFLIAMTYQDFQDPKGGDQKRKEVIRMASKAELIEQVEDLEEENQTLRSKLEEIQDSISEILDQEGDET